MIKITLDLKSQCSQIDILQHVHVCTETEYVELAGDKRQSAHINTVFVLFYSL